MLVPVYLDVLASHGDFADAEIEGERVTLTKVTVRRKRCCAECGAEIRVGETAWVASAAIRVSRKKRWCNECYSSGLRMDVDGQDDIYQA